MTQEQEDLFFRKLKITSNFGITVYGGVSERENTRRLYSEGRRMFLALVESVVLYEVYFYDYVRKIRDNGGVYFDKTLIGEGIFHQFGCNYEEFETGPGNYTTAVIETDNGEVKNVPVELIVFKEPIKEILEAKE